MKTKLFTLLLAVAASVGTMFAWDYEHVQIGDLYYNLDESQLTAEVTSHGGEGYSITTANIPSSIEYKTKTFSVTGIGGEAFSGCKSLTSVTIPNSVTSIFDAAFYNCTSLASITIPNSVTGIGQYAFEACSGLISISIGSGVNSIADRTFTTGNSLISINVDNGNTTFSSKDGVLFNKDKTAIIRYPSGITAESYTIPNSVTRIEVNAFNGCPHLTSIEIPNSVTSIGEWAFSGCRGLTSVTIPNSVTSIGRGAFSDCSGLISVTIGNSVTSIGDEAFWGCLSLTSINIPNNVISIGGSAFSNCNFTSVTIGSGVTSIGDYAFGSNNLISIVVDENNQYYSSVDGVLFDKNKTILIRYPAKKVGESYSIPNTVTSIGVGAFSFCSDLTSVTIPNSVTSIGDNAFSSSVLPSIEIPNSVTSIGVQAFMYCSNLSSVTIGNSVKSIGGSAFHSCSLTSIEIPNSVTSIGGSPFGQNSNLTSITVAEDNPNYISEDGVLFDKDKKTLIQYPIGDKRHSYIIPNTVTRIGDFAFYDCCCLTSVTIPNSVTSMGGYAFGGFPSLTSIICEIIYPLTVDYEVFSHVDKSIPLYVPARSIGLYKSADQWKEFTNILSIEEEWDPEGPVNPGKYELKLLVNDETMGSVIGEGLYAQGTEVTITAIPAGGCRFVRWSDGNTDAERTIILTIDTTFTAYFEPYYITMNFETATEQIAGRWFAFGVPFDVAVSTGIFIVDTDDPALCNYDFVIDEYDGALRASTQNGWKRVASNDTLKPGRFYMIAPKAAREWRFEATRNSTFNEQNSVTVNAYPSEHGEHHSGWNGIANPFWTSATAELEGVIYATVYNNYYGVYSTELLSEKEWSAAEPFFVQTPNDGEVVFSAENTPSPSGAPMRMELSSDKTIAYTLELADASSSYADKAYITTFEGKENRYKIGRDLEKMQVNNAIVPQLWFEAYGTHLAAYEVPSSNDEFLASIGLFAPQEGTYTLSISNIPDNTDIFLTKNGQEIWNLANAPYSLTLKEGESDEYALHSYKMPTSIEDINNNKNDEYTKLLLNGQILILRGEKVYTVTGQQIR